MRWSSGNRGNIEDASGRSGMGLAAGCRSASAGSLVLLVLSWATGTDLLSLLGGGSGAPSSSVESTRHASRDDAAGRADGRFRGRGGRRHAGHLAAASGQPLRTHTRRPVPRRDAVRAAVPAEARPVRSTAPAITGVSRSELLQRAVAALRRARRFRPGLRGGARVRASRAEPPRHERPRAWRQHGREQRVGRARTAGRLLRRHLGPRSVEGRHGSKRAMSSWSLATRTKRCGRRRSSATTTFRRWRPDVCSRSASRTARRRSEWSGSSAA